MVPEDATQKGAGSRVVVVALMNAYTQGLSGGDIWFMEVARRWRDAELIVVTSALGMSTCVGYGVKGRFLITSHESKFGHLTVTYVLRTLRAVRLVNGMGPVDIVYSTSDAPPDVLPALWLRLRRRNVRWIQRIFHVVPAKSERLMAWVVQLAIHSMIRLRVDRVFVDSEVLKAQMIARRLPEPRISVSYPGLKSLSVPERRGRCYTSPTVDRGFDALFVARFHRSKGVFDLPLIWAAVVERVPHARLAMVGYCDDSRLRELEAECERHGVRSAVDILGFVSPDDLEGPYTTARVFVFPSHEEGYGMAISDALCRGLPVVAWDLPTYREHFSDCVVQVPEDDITAFAEAIVCELQGEKAKDWETKRASWLTYQRTWEEVADQEWALTVGSF